MSASIYLQINLIPMIALIIMRVNTTQTLSYSWRNRALRFMMVLVALSMLTNTLAWMLNGTQLPGVAILLWILNTIYFCVVAFTAYLWALYVRDIVDGGSGQLGRMVFGPSVPLILFEAAMVTNPWTHLIFYVDEQNFYVRGKGFLLQSVLMFGYVGTATCKAFLKCRKERNVERRTEYRWLSYFAILPIIGGLCQLMLYGTELLMPFTAASLLMVYVNVQQKQVTRDGLTGLNNRSRLEEYITELQENEWDGKTFYVLMMDVDHFKQINDTYGHLIGDEVLRMVADQMKRVFGETKSFLGRYGGDEFVFIIRDRTEQQVREDIKTLKESIAGMHWGKDKDTPWQISVSIGGIRNGECGVHGVEEMLSLADARMYENKRRNRERRF